MCGRYTLHASGELLWEEFALEGEPEVIAPHYNIAPTQEVLVVGRREGRGRGSVTCAGGSSPRGRRTPPSAAA